MEGILGVPKSWTYQERHKKGVESKVQKGYQESANRLIWGDSPWFFCTKYQKIGKKFKVDSAFPEFSH